MAERLISLDLRTRAQWRRWLGKHHTSSTRVWLIRHKTTHPGRPAVDAAGSVSCRPDFALALYSGHLAVPETNFTLNPDIQITSRTPPTFLLHAEDDPIDPVENSRVYHAALRKAGVPAEMHVYGSGGHAFGLRPTKHPITRWPQLAETWLRTIGIITR